MISKKVPKIPAAEWEIMNVLWSESALTGAEIHKRLTGSGRALKTTNTLLARLVNRGALSAEKKSRAFRYRPLVTREACAREESTSFVRRVLGGQWSPLVVQLVKEAELSDADITELEALLRAKRDGAKS